MILMGTDADGDRSERNLELFGSVAVPIALFAITVVAGTLGYLLYLPSLPAYANSSTLQIASEGFFRALGFLVLAMGTISIADPLPLVLLTIGRLAGFLFFFYAALAGFGLLFAERLKPLRIEAWSWLGRLPGADDRGHVLVCGLGDNGYALTAEALEDGRNVVAVDIERDDRTAELESMGAIVIEGDARNESLIRRRARIHSAESVYLTTGTDTTNGVILETFAQSASRTKSDSDEILDVTARVGDRRLRRTLHDQVSANDGLYLRTYSVPEATASTVLSKAKIDNIEELTDRVHIWIVGWTPFTRALVEQLLQLMYYPRSIDRRITIIVDDPSAVEESIMAMAPGIDPDWWDDPEVSELVRSLFPEIDIRQLPTADLELLSDSIPLYESLRAGDRLTIFADDSDTPPLRALLTTWGPKLDELVDRYELSAQIYYRDDGQSSWEPPVSSIQTSSYEAFGDGCSIQEVNGEERDFVARRLALIYHLLYDETLVEGLPDWNAMPFDSDGDFETIMSWLDSQPPETVEQYATIVWRSLPEYQRESNRHAAAHAPVKHRSAALLNERTQADSEAVIRSLAKAEHRRWCAEKILDGWEPLPDSKADRWATDEGEDALRRQRYHPDIRSVASLETEMEGEWDKDISQVSAILNHPSLIGHETIHDDS